MKLFAVALLLLVVLPAGCERENGDAAAPAPAPSSSAAPGDVAAAPRVASPAPPAATRSAAGPRVVFLGDSITAGLGLDAEQAFPALLAETLGAEGLPVQVVNAGVSGDTTAGGLRRLDWLLRQKPDVVVVGLGGNDGLRGLELKASEQNLREIVRNSREAGAKVLLLGMLIPPNYGPEYTSQFRELYPRVAKETGAALVPFLLEGVGGEARLNQPDGIHPTAEGHQVIARTVVPHLRDLVPPSDEPMVGQRPRPGTNGNR